MKRLIAFLTICLTLVIQSYGQDNGLLWKITGPDGAEASYLFGTYHLIGSDYLKEHKKVYIAFKNSSTVIVETELDSSAMMAVAMKGMMLNNSLRKLLDSADYALVKENLEPELSISLAQADQMKPAMISVMYTMVIAQKLTPPDLNFSGEAIDSYFANDGRKQNKKIVSLETPLDQAKILFESQSLEEQAEDLVELAEDTDEAERMTKVVLDAYLAEDIITMWEETKDMEEAYGDMSELVDKRNKKWIGQLKPHLDKGDTFIAVGALHLPGKNGLIKLLKSQGYTVSPVL